MAIVSCSSPPVKYGDLLRAVLSGEVMAACPVALWMHHPGRDQDARSLADATCDFQRTFDLDFAKLTPASTYQLIDYGARDRLAGDALGRRTVVDRVIGCPDDWLRLRPYLLPGEFAGRIVAAAALARRRLPHSVPVIATVFNPLFQAVALAGIETLRLHATDRPDLLQHGLGVLTANTCRLIQTYRDAGVDGIFLASQQATSAAFDWEAYLKWGLPGDIACFDAAHGMLSFYHLHGDGIFPDLPRMARPSVLHYDATPANPAPEALLAAGRAGVATGIDVNDTERGGFLDGVRARLDRWKGPRFILAPGCALRLDSPVAVLHAVVAAARVVRQ